MTVIALTNQKGGVGKSTTAFHLARAAIQSGRKVLLVDLDPQGNLTSIATKEVMPDEGVGLADAMSSRTPETITDVIVPGVWDNLDVAPTPPGEALGTVRDELVLAGAGREGRLREALKQVDGRYDITLIDCPPSLDQLTINGLTAAHQVLIVTQTALFSSNGLARLLSTVDSVKTYYNPTLTIAGIIMNQHEARTVRGRYWADGLKEAAEARNISIFTPPIPKRTVIGDAAEAARGLDEWGSGDAAELSAIYQGYLQTLLEKGAS